MGAVSEELADAVARSPSDAMMPGGLIVKVAKLRHENYPGRDARGVLPVMVVGHEALDEVAWGDWVRQHGISHYGAGYTERVIRDGIELKEMLPTSGFGRNLRIKENGRGFGSPYELKRAESLLVAIEKWPGLYNLIATEMAEQEMTLRQFLDRIYNLPSPWELGAGADTTLGDLIGPPLHMTLPDY